jgi:hypothetical protein
MRGPLYTRWNVGSVVETGFHGEIEFPPSGETYVIKYASIHGRNGTANKASITVHGFTFPGTFNASILSMTWTVEIHAVLGVIPFACQEMTVPILGSEQTVTLNCTAGECEFFIGGWKLVWPTPTTIDQPGTHR